MTGELPSETHHESFLLHGREAAVEKKVGLATDVRENCGNPWAMAFEWPFRAK